MDTSGTALLALLASSHALLDSAAALHASAGGDSEGALALALATAAIAVKRATVAVTGSASARGKRRKRSSEGSGVAGGSADDAFSSSEGDSNIPLSLLDTAPYIAQAGHHSTADVLAQVNSEMRVDERVWRAISRLRAGLSHRTRLSAAARAGDVARCTFLVNHGATVNAWDACGRSPLTEALQHEHTRVAAFLRGQGARETPLFAGIQRAAWASRIVVGGGVDRVYTLALLGEDAAHVGVGHRSGAIRVCVTASGAATQTLLGHTNAVRALLVLPKAARRLPLGTRDLLASGSWDHSIRLWDTTSGACEHTLLGHTDGVNALALLRGGLLASGSNDSSVRVWDLRSVLSGVAAAATVAATLIHASAVWSLAACPGGRLLSGCQDGSIALWSSTHEQVATLGGHAFLPVSSLVLFSDATRFASGHDAPGLIRVWSLTRLSLLLELHGHTDCVRCLAVLPDGRLLSGSFDRELRVWDPYDGRVECTAVLTGHHTDALMAAVIIPDGSGRVLSGSADGTVREWV